MPGWSSEHCHFFHITVYTVCFFSTCDGFCRCQPQAGSHFKVDRSSKWVTSGRAWTWCTGRERMMVQTIHFVTQGKKLIKNKTFFGSWTGVWYKSRAGTRNVQSRSNAITSVTNESKMMNVSRKRQLNCEPVCSVLTWSEYTSYESLKLKQRTP